MKPRSLRYTALLVILLLCSCSEITRHKVLTTIFDGVPSLPSAEQYCADYAAEAIKREHEEAGKAKQAKATTTTSIHPPYAQKLCDDCHDKTTESGFVLNLSKTQLCFHCHTTFIEGYRFVHGPVAIGDCLACHDPHSTSLPHLLKFPAADICGNCHKERRQAEAMHTQAISHGLVCINCHSPHFGNARFFLK